MIEPHVPLAISVAVTTFLAPKDARALLRAARPQWAYDFWDTLSPALQDEASETAGRLDEHGWTAASLGDSEYPERLTALRAPPPVLFLLGSTSLLTQPAIGMCGSRHASEPGLRAARACAQAAAVEGVVVVSGNASGVDRAAHDGALASGGSTILVLPEGASHHRPTRWLRDTPDRVLVLSQFAPRRPWHVSHAMARNGVIAALSDALVVVEAGGEGGTLDAGKQALALGRPVIALEFESMPTPPGNAYLHDRGAIRLSRASELPAMLGELRSGSHDRQMGLPI